MNNPDNQIEITGAAEEVAPVEEFAEEVDSFEEEAGEVVLDLELTESVPPAVAEVEVEVVPPTPKPTPTEKAPKGKKFFIVGRSNIQFDKKLYQAGGFIALTPKEAEQLSKFITPI